MANNINRIIERELIFENLCEECQTMEDKDDLLSIPGAQSVLQMPWLDILLYLLLISMMNNSEN